MAEYTQNDVQELITGMITMGGMLNVNERGQIFWASEPDSPITIKVEGDGTGILYTYTTNPDHPDAVIINPFAEGVTVSADRNWFYKVMSVIASNNLEAAMRFLLNLAMEEGTCPYPDFVQYLKPIAGRVDEKVLQEFEYITNAGSDGFFSIAYNSTAKETKIFLGIEDPSGDYQKAIPSTKVRKKTWQLLMDLVKAIFKTKGPVAMEYKEATASMTCPQFRTFLPVWFNVWKAIAPIVAEAVEESERTLGSDVLESIERIEKHLDRIDIYHKMCQWGTSTGMHRGSAKSAKSVMKKSVGIAATAQQQQQPQEESPFTPTPAFVRSEPKSSRTERWAQQGSYGQEPELSRTEKWAREGQFIQRQSMFGNSQFGGGIGSTFGNSTFGNSQFGGGGGGRFGSSFGGRRRF